MLREMGAHVMQIGSVYVSADFISTVTDDRLEEVGQQDPFDEVDASPMLLAVKSPPLFQDRQIRRAIKLIIATAVLRPLATFHYLAKNLSAHHNICTPVDATRCSTERFSKLAFPDNRSPTSVNRLTPDSSSFCWGGITETSAHK